VQGGHLARHGMEESWYYLLSGIGMQIVYEYRILSVVRSG